MRIPTSLSLLALAACATTEPQRLDTTSFLVDLVAADGSTMPDHLVFAPGGFESTACRDYGFRRADYRAWRDGATTTFESTATNRGDAATVWHGVIRGDAIEGTMTSNDGKGGVSSYRYRGTRERGALDGRTFRIVLIDEADGHTDDTLVFAAGSFDSTGCHDHGFGAAPYTVTSEGGRTTFAATTTSAQHGSMAWRGTVDGDALAGEAVRTDPDGSAHRATFTTKTTR